MLAYLITEPELSTAGPLDPTLDAASEDDRLLAALAYEVAPAGADGCWIPARRRPNAAVLPIA